MRLLFLLYLLPTSYGLRLASFFNSHMVLQRSPQSARIYGFDALSPESVQAFMSCSINGEKLSSLVVPGMHNSQIRSKASGYWEVELPPQSAGTLCDISIMEESTRGQAGDSLDMKGVLFGDVWLCSGQSNMRFPMKSIMNSSEEITASASYSDIRFTVIEDVTSDKEEEDVGDLWGWLDPSSAHLGQMSAVCFLYARNIYDMMLERGERVPLGLIDSDWGGTRIEAWSNKEALESCGIVTKATQYNVQPRGPSANSCLWNAMIAPLRRIALMGFLWYQGEANSGYHRELYNCTFPALINTWRQEFSNPEAPFGFVQLSTVSYTADTLEFPHVRAHQTADHHTVPNPVLPNTFMAVAADTYDEEHGIHPRYKQVVGHRLAVAGMNVAYGVKEFPSQGPVASSVNIQEDSGVFRLSYDQEFVYSDTELTGFFMCCGLPGVCRDTLDAQYWPAIGKGQVSVHPESRSLDISGCECNEEGDMLSLAYLWRQTPIQTPVWGAPIYAADSYRLPSPPWIWADIL